MGIDLARSEDVRADFLVFLFFRSAVADLRMGGSLLEGGRRSRFVWGARRGG